MTPKLVESDVEEVALDWFEGLGYTRLFGPSLLPGEAGAERAGAEEVLLVGRLRTALSRINKRLPTGAIEDAVRKIQLVESPSLVETNRRFHEFLVDGIDVEYRRDGRIVGDKVWLVDWLDPSNNDFLAVNQYAVVENKHHRRPDIVVFVNGIPLGVIELKNAADEDATINGAFKQIQTYKLEIPGLFAFNEAIVISDGLLARVGTLSSNWERFQPWRTVEGDDLAPKGSLELETLVKGIFEPGRLLDLIRHFIVFEAGQDEIAKKLAGYHQFHAVNKALQSTIQATSAKGDRRVGVVWHTQGSGKSLTMAFYAGKVILHPAMENPTLVVLTDRNDLDHQLFGVFSRCHHLLRQKPVQAESRDHLRKLLKVASGGVIFTTIQKFLPEGETPLLSDRRNILVIADEAHRSQYGFKARVVRGKGEIKYGLAKHLRDSLPRASYMGFTGTPIEKADKNTRAVFGDYVDVYDIQRAVEDGATVRIYYEGRLAKIELKKEERPRIDPDFEEVTEEEETETKEKLKSKWARLEAMVGTEKRIGLIARDIVDHFEKRLSAMDGKAMIVCMSRRICVELHNAIVKLRPAWHDPDDAKGAIKVVMTASATDGPEWAQHSRNKARREALAMRYKDPADPMRLVIVRDMWLTGFDAPSMHTMYLDKPMQGHNLMQAIARVNRVFKDKPGGLVVDYLGLADQLKKALTEYTERDRNETGVPQEQAVRVFLEKLEVVEAMMHGFDYSKFLTGTPEQRLRLLPQAMDHIVKQDNGAKRYVGAVSALSSAFALAVPHEDALAQRERLAFFQAVRAGLVKATVSEQRAEDLDAAVRQIVSRAVASDEVVDIFKAAGLKKVDISILSETFLEEVRKIPYKNLALEMLRKLLSDEIRTRMKKNVVQARSFSEMLEEAIRKYQNRSLDAAKVIEALIDLAKTMQAAQQRGEKLKLSDEELAFYDALSTNLSAKDVMGEPLLKKIAQELVETVRRNVSIDWTSRESIRAKMRVMVKKVLKKHGYPPDRQEKATQTVLEQAEVLCRDWAA